ncbi:MAG: hypothetical protein UT82_C0034G0003 [Parcubacteria group bacterium GW2011_GWB1_40_14]|nr:MAG: hypothetical protein UT82_C0034G0003 [Parcubacteria group bacterium GW2011_GWB1_40_14]
MVKSKAQVSESVGFISRIDFGSPGYRRGLLELAFDVFRKEKVKFIVLVTGLVSTPALKPLLTQHKTKEDKLALIHSFAEDLANDIPRLTHEDGKPVKIYIVTSQATTYDSWLGREVAARMHILRPKDIFFRGESSARFVLPRLGRDIWALAPVKAAWRGDYFSTVPERIIRDKQKQSSQKYPDVYVVGGTASAILRPQGEMPRPYISLPALHRIMEVNTSENQIGVTVLEIFKDTAEPFEKNYSFKDMVSPESERSNVIVPDTLPKLQQDILNELKRMGPSTVGLLEDALPPSRETIEKAIVAINASGFKPQIMHNEKAGEYQFDPVWFQSELKYNLPADESVSEDRMLAFSCLHAGSVYTEMKFFANSVPEFMLRHNIDILIGCGDFIQGLKHDLATSGETIDGTNYTDHERLSSKLVNAVITKVFDARFSDGLAKLSQRAKKSSAIIENLINASLIRFYYINGNHDEWVVPLGMSPLAIFHRDLLGGVTSDIYAILTEHGVTVDSNFLKTTIEDHIVKTKIFALPLTGLTVDVSHPHMGRASTSSLRSQEMLRKSQCHICMIGNFHIAIKTAQWDSVLGQRIAMQQGSIVWKTNFEDGKTKLLDVVVAYLRVKSANGRIFMTEAMYYGSGTENPDLSKSDPLEGVLKNLNI